MLKLDHHRAISTPHLTFGRALPPVAPLAPPVTLPLLPSNPPEGEGWRTVSYAATVGLALYAITVLAGPHDAPQSSRETVPPISKQPKASVSVQATASASNAALLLEQVTRLNQAGQPRAALDLVFGTLDEHLRRGEFAACDAVLRDVRHDGLDPMVAIGFLTITRAAADKLPSRTGLVDRLREWLPKQIGERRAADLLGRHA